MSIKTTVEDRTYLDSLISAKFIMENSKNNGSDELLSTYINGIVLPLLDENNINYSKRYEKLLKIITDEIDRLTPSSIHKNFYE